MISKRDDSCQLQTELPMSFEYRVAFQEKNDAFKVRFRAKFLYKDVQSSTPKEFGRIAAHKKRAPFQMKIKKQGAQSSQMKMRNAELCLKGVSKKLKMFTACSRLQEDYPK